jgi:DNA adenine methylase
MADRSPLRWIGGKQRYADVVAGYLRTVVMDGGRYFEPFVGGASIFFALRPEAAVLGDSNSDLIEFYNQLEVRPLELWSAVNELAQDVTTEVYYQARNEFNSGCDGLRRAALFLFLNRTGFNGIWRVNRSGHYNVPFGDRGLALCDLETWLSFAGCLSRATLVCEDYPITLKKVRAGDAVYLDPPYFVSTGRELFTRYTHAGFSRADHLSLSKEMDRLTGLGARVVLTIREDPFIMELYRDYKIDSAGVKNCVNARGGHSRVVDLTIRNFD